MWAVCILTLAVRSGKPCKKKKRPTGGFVCVECRFLGALGKWAMDGFVYAQEMWTRTVRGEPSGDV